MNSQIQYTHLGARATLYQVTKRPLDLYSNNGIINFKGHSLKKVYQPNRVSVRFPCDEPCTSTGINTDNIFRCTKPNCYFSCKETDISATQNSNNGVTAKQTEWLDEGKANEAFPWIEFNLKQQVVAQLYTMMSVSDFDIRDSELTKEEIAKNTTMTVDIKLKNSYVRKLLNKTNLQQQCPYLHSILDPNIDSSKQIITTEGVKFIKKLITDIMKQQDIDIEFMEDGNTWRIYGYIKGSRGLYMEYNLKYLVDHYDTVFDVVASLIKDVEFDKIISKLSKTYPQVFDKKSKFFIDTWKWNENTITFQARENFAYSSGSNNSFNTIEVNIDTFFNMDDMIFDFGLLEEVLNSMSPLALAYNDLFNVDDSTSGRATGETEKPQGLLSPDMFLRLPLQ
jgi:hypothetical protein